MCSPHTLISARLRRRAELTAVRIAPFGGIRLYLTFLQMRVWVNGEARGGVDGAGRVFHLHEFPSPSPFPLPNERPALEGTLVHFHSTSVSAFSGTVRRGTFPLYLIMYVPQPPPVFGGQRTPVAYWPRWAPDASSVYAVRLPHQRTRRATNVAAVK